MGLHLQIFRKQTKQEDKEEGRKGLSPDPGNTRARSSCPYTHGAERRNHHTAKTEVCLPNSFTQNHNLDAMML